ncbi:hypothetical protein [Corynebacterium senegalense]|uniref:hypothetical protein n=1 Tax=Corynebacterium senegalense TaxID=2080750 RepID=UPI0011C065D3|nr:hypothetical protein [Corynebacterium senegalense]
MSGASSGAWPVSPGTMSTGAETGNSVLRPGVGPSAAPLTVRWRRSVSSSSPPAESANSSG